MELFDSSEMRVDSPVPDVLGAVPKPIPSAVLKDAFVRLKRCAETDDICGLFAATSEVLPNYRRAEFQNPSLHKPSLPVGVARKAGSVLYITQANTSSSHP